MRYYYYYYYYYTSITVKVVFFQYNSLILLFFTWNYNFECFNCSYDSMYSQLVSHFYASQSNGFTLNSLNSPNLFSWKQFSCIFAKYKYRARNNSWPLAIFRTNSWLDRPFHKMLRYCDLSSYKIITCISPIKLGNDQANRNMLGVARTSCPNKRKLLFLAVLIALKNLLIQ